MDTATIIALAGIFSTLCAAVLTNLVNARTSIKVKRLELIGKNRAEQIAKREIEYAAFIEEASALALASYKQKSGDVREFSKLTSHASKILLFSDEIGNSAFDISSHVLEMHITESEESAEKNARSETFGVVRHRFVKLCREDIEALRSEI